MDASNKVPAATLRYRFRFLGQRWRFLKRPLELENPATFPKLNIAIREPSVEQMMNESMISLQESSHQDRQRSTIGIAETKETSNITVDIPINNLQDMLNGDSMGVDGKRPPFATIPPEVSAEGSLESDLKCLRIFYQLPRSRDKLVRPHHKPRSSNLWDRTTPRHPQQPIPSAASFRQQLSRKHKISLGFT